MLSSAVRMMVAAMAGSMMEEGRLTRLNAASVSVTEWASVNMVMTPASGHNACPGCATGVHMRAAPGAFRTMTAGNNRQIRNNM